MSTPSPASSSSKGKHVLEFKKLVVPTGMRSIYWRYFGFPGSESGEILTREKIICTLCKFQMSYNGNTSNLRMHLQNKHSQYLVNLIAASQPYIAKKRKPRNRKVETIVHSSSFQGEVETKSLDSDSAEPTIRFIINTEVEPFEGEPSNNVVEESNVVQSTPSRNEPVRVYEEVNLNEIGDALLKFFINDLISPILIDSQSFQDLVSKLNPSISLPNANQLEEDVIPQQYEMLKHSIKSDLKEVTDLSLSLEEWTNASKIVYYTLSVHYLADEELISKVLSTFPIETDEFYTITAIIREWGIKMDHVVAIVVSSSNRDLIEYLNTIAPTIPCFSYTLQKAIYACFSVPVMETLLNKCRNLLDQLKINPPGDVPVSCTISTDYPGLWASTYNMLEALKNSKSEIDAVTEESSWRLTSIDWEILNMIIEVLSPFKVTVQTLEEEAPSFASIIKPLLCQLISNYLEPKINDDEISQQLKEALKSRLCDVYDAEHSFLGTASMLDPRFKKLTYASTDEVCQTHENIKDLMFPIASELSCKTSPTVDSKKRLSGMELLLGDLCSSRQTMNPSVKVDLEFTHYTSELPVQFDENPLRWWHSSLSKFPVMNKLVKKYLCVPACSIQTYKVSVKQREHFERHRSILPNSLIDKMLFLNGNFNIRGEISHFLA